MSYKLFLSHLDNMKRACSLNTNKDENSHAIPIAIKNYLRMKLKYILENKTIFSEYKIVFSSTSHNIK